MIPNIVWGWMVGADCGVVTPGVLTALLAGAKLSELSCRRMDMDACRNASGGPSPPTSAPTVLERPLARADTCSAPVSPSYLFHGRTPDFFFLRAFPIGCSYASLGPSPPYVTSDPTCGEVARTRGVFKPPLSPLVSSYPYECVGVRGYVGVPLPDLSTCRT